MKPKIPKRSISNKPPEHRRPSLASTSIFDTSTISSKRVDLGNGTVHLDAYSSCLKTYTILKTQKVLKRELLRCSDQRPSLLGAQTLQPPRIHHVSHQSPASTASSTVHHQQPVRRRSLSMNSRTFYATIDRIGPWPDVSISRLRSDGNELLRPLKNFRSLKNPRVFSPKYYTAMTENPTKFKYYPSTRSYIDEYRKQKGYLLGLQTPAPINPHPLSIPLIHQRTEEEEEDEEEEDQPTIVGDFGTAGTNLNSGFVGDRTVVSTTDLSLPANAQMKSTNDFTDSTSTPPSIPSVTKVFHEPHHGTSFPSINMRNGHLRPTRHPPHHSVIAQQSQHQQALALPSLTASSLHYISSMNSVEKAYSNSRKGSMPPPSKLFFIDGRRKRRYVDLFSKYVSTFSSHVEIEVPVVWLVIVRYDV